MIGQGEQAPDFELADQDGPPLRLSDPARAPRGPRLLPKADTPGCNTQACSIRDRGHPEGVAEDP
jgi:peroxiredoxin Q/BCP